MKSLFTAPAAAIVLLLCSGSVAAGEPPFNVPRTDRAQEGTKQLALLTLRGNRIVNLRELTNASPDPHHAD